MAESIFMADTMLIARSRCCQTTRTRARDEHCALRSPSFQTVDNLCHFRVVGVPAKTPRFGLAGGAVPSAGRVSNISGHGRALRFLHGRSTLTCEILSSVARGPKLPGRRGPPELRNAHIEQNWQGFQTSHPRSFRVVWDTGVTRSQKAQVTSWHCTNVFINH